MLELGNKFQHSHQRQLTELELVRHSAMRDTNELLGSDRSVALQNLSLFNPSQSRRRDRVAQQGRSQERTYIRFSKGFAGLGPFPRLRTYRF